MIDKNAMKQFKFREVFEKLLDKIIWTHKIQCCEIDILTKRYKTLTTLKIVFYALSVSGVIASACLQAYIASIISAIVILLVTILDEVLKIGSYPEKTSKIKIDTNALLHLKNKVVLEIIKLENPDKTEDLLIEELYRVCEEDYERICSTLSEVSEKAIKLASAKLKGRKDEQVNREIVKDALND